jgi:serine phosphatase RsbU (regulator of sigma subunit)
MGRGVQAASVMAQMRSAVRTLLAIDPEPEAVMAGLDRVFERWHVEQLVSVVYAVADPQLGVVRIINAGHPSPLLLKGDGSSEHVVAPSTLILGVGGGERSVVTRFFNVGDTLLLYTDGLVERRGEDLDAGDARLLDASDCLTGDLDAGLDELVKRLRDPSRDDDVAVLALRRTPVPVVPVDGLVGSPAFVAGVGS